MKGRAERKGWGNIKKNKSDEGDRQERAIRSEKNSHREAETERYRRKREKKAHVLSILSGRTKGEPNLAVNPLLSLSCHSLRLQRIQWISIEPCKNIKLYLVLIPGKKKSNVHMLSFSSSFGLSVL